MGKNKHKDKKQKKSNSADPPDPNEVIAQLRKENEGLRARLEKIAELTHDLRSDDPDDYDDASRDADALIAGTLPEETSRNV